MRQKITGFHQDEFEHWVADLACGHSQHVRHDPPWQLRPWVTSEPLRRQKIGSELDCVICEESGSARDGSDESGDDAADTD